MKLYEEKILANVSMQTRLAIKGAFFSLFVSFLFFGDLYLDHINVFPKPLFFLFVFLSLKKLKGFIPIKKASECFVLVSFFVSICTFLYRIIRLATDAEFPFTFPYEALALIFGVCNIILTLITALIALKTVFICAETYTTYPYRKGKLFLTAFSVILALLSFSQYLFVGRSDLVVALQWIFYAITLYVHKNCLDEIQAEAEYKLM